MKMKTQKICKTERCGRVSKSRGFCNSCYEYSRKNDWKIPDLPPGERLRLYPLGQVCLVNGCERQARSLGMCNTCWDWSHCNGKVIPTAPPGNRGQALNGTWTGRTCETPECEKKVKAHGLCVACHSELLRKGERPTKAPGTKYRKKAGFYGETCTLDGCDRSHQAHGLCMLHYKTRRGGERYRRLALRRLPQNCFVFGCRENVSLHTDHVRPVSCGGSGDIYNLQMLCAKHHKPKHTRWANYDFRLTLWSNPVYFRETV